MIINRRNNSIDLCIAIRLQIRRANESFTSKPSSSAANDVEKGQKLKPLVRVKRFDYNCRISASLNREQRGSDIRSVQRVAKVDRVFVFRRNFVRSKTTDAKNRINDRDNHSEKREPSSAIHLAVRRPDSENGQLSTNILGKFDLSLAYIRTRLPPGNFYLKLITE